MQDQRQDGYVNVLNNFGTQRDSSTAYRYEPEGLIPDMDLTMHYEGDGLFARIVDYPAEEALKHGYDFEGMDDDTKKLCNDVLDYIDWDESVITALKWSRLYGGSIIVMLIDDGGRLEDPLNYDAIRGIDELRVYERAIVTPDYTTMPEGDPGGENEESAAELPAAPAPVAEEKTKSSLQSVADGGILSTDRKGWNTSENGEHFLVGEDGSIQGGFGGKYNGEKPSAALKKKQQPKRKPPQPPAAQPAPQAAGQSQKESPKPAAQEALQDEPFDISKVPKKDINQIEKGSTRYIGSMDSLMINQAFWAGNESELPRDRKKVVEALDRNMRPIGQATSVYRYIDDEDPLFSARPGQSVTNAGYSSTTSGDHSFDRRPGKVEIRVPSTGKVYIPQNRSENETIIHRGATFKIVSRKVVDGKVDIVAELVE